MTTPLSRDHGKYLMFYVDEFSVFGVAGGTYVLLEGAADASGHGGEKSLDVAKRSVVCHRHGGWERVHR